MSLVAGNWRDRALQLLTREGADSARLGAPTGMQRLHLCIACLLSCTACAKDKSQQAPERLDAPWRFGDGEFLESVQWGPAGDSAFAAQGLGTGGKGQGYANALRAGDAFLLHWRGSAGLNRGLVWALLPCTQSAEQHYPRVDAVAGLPSRARRWPVTASQRSLRLEVPADWQERCAMLLAVRNQGQEGIALNSAARSPSSDPPTAGTAKVAQVAIIELQSPPPRVEVPFAEQPITIDGRDSDWPAQTEARELVHSLSGRRLGVQKTQLRFLWNQDALFVFAKLQDQDLWAPDKKRDAPLYRKEALEIFLSSDGSKTDYLELEISAANVIFDARFERHRQGERSYDGPWQHAVKLEGTLNNARDRDRGWSVEMALPWAELCAQTRISCPPLPGSVLRVNVFRLESPRRKAQEGTALSPVYRPDFHAMDRAAFLRLLR